MLLLSIKDREKRELTDRIKSGTVMSESLRRFLISREQRSRGWDGYVHPSSLDWNSSVDTQVKKLKKAFRPTVEALQRMEVGNIIHEYIQDKNHKYFFKNKSISEEHITNHKILFRGTPDQYGPHEDLGLVLFEYKSVSSYQRDKAFADKMIKRVTPADLAANKLTPADIEAIYNRLCVTHIDYKGPKSDHLTQAFTYVFVMKMTKGVMPDWVCINYIRKETLDTIEFWYEVKKHPELLHKAKENYKMVLGRVLKDPEAIAARELSKR